MSHPLFSKLLEVWNPDQKSFYTACLLDIDDGTGIGVIQIIGSSETQQTPLSNLRPCQPSETDPSLLYSNHEQVEVRFELEGQGPSWWEGRIKGSRVTNDPPSYLVTFDDAEYTNTYCTQNIRKSVGVPRIVLKKNVLPIPRTIVMHAEESLAKLDSRQSLFCLRLIKDSMGRDFVLIIGHPDDVDYLCDPQNFQFQVAQLERIAELNKKLAAARLANPKHKEVLVFEIPSSLVGLSLGKGGSRIQELQRRDGIHGIQIGKEPVNGRVKVTIESKTVSDAEACREAFELEEHRIDTGGIDFNLATQELEDLKTKSGILVSKIESRNHVTCIGTRESLRKFHNLFGLEKIYLPDIVTRQKELLAVERPSSSAFRSRGFSGRGGSAISRDIRGESRFTSHQGGAVEQDFRPVIKHPKQQQPLQKSTEKDITAVPASIAITVSSSGGTSAQRTVRTVPQQPQLQQKSQQLQNLSGPQEQLKKPAAKHQQQQKKQPLLLPQQEIRPIQHSRPQRTVAVPLAVPEGQKNVDDAKDICAQVTVSMKVGDGMVKPQRPQKIKAMSSASSTFSDASQAADAAPSTSSAENVFASPALQSAAVVVADTAGAATADANLQ